MSLKILTGFDGSCPHFKQGVRQEAQDRFVLFASIRRRKGKSEEVPGCGSRFNVRVVNSGDRAARAVLVADWGTAERTLHHDYGYIRHELWNEWTMVPGRREASRVEYHLDFLPGLTHVGYLPEYNYTDCGAWVERMRGLGVETKVIGRSREKRAIWQVILPSPNPQARNFFVQARDHAYETAGNYCVEGMVEFLRSGSEMAEYIRGKFNVLIIPMSNPDGVYNGMSRLTWERGADMNRVRTAADPAHDAVKRAIDRARPSVYLNIHNWTGKFEDGLLANDRGMMERILAHLPADMEHHKRWYMETSEDYLKQIGKTECPPENQSWKNYIKKKFDGVGVTLEFPWFGRDTAAMRGQGRKAFIAVALAAIEERGF